MCQRSPHQLCCVARGNWDALMLWEAPGRQRAALTPVQHHILSISEHLLPSGVLARLRLVPTSCTSLPISHFSRLCSVPIGSHAAPRHCPAQPAQLSRAATSRQQSRSRREAAAPQLLLGAVGAPGRVDVGGGMRPSLLLSTVLRAAFLLALLLPAQPGPLLT